ncbi:UNVERIFIED_CONTAM: hypothetical protein Sangu_1742000 [Sesamum angustifolium]|uniref:DUF4283 domain-containing protein n=1 Tax=Sesamum angustifolium TaxID=2727405 RepID=A0AAW2M5E4_9LAMI
MMTGNASLLEVLTLFTADRSFLNRCRIALSSRRMTSVLAPQCTREDRLLVGHPIAMDSLTMRMERVSYARILVEVDASKALVDHVEFKLQNGVTRRQPVVYEYKPKFCTECNRFGHHKSSCGDNQQPSTAAATATAAVGKSAANKQPTTKKALPTEWTLVQRRQQTEHKQPQTAGT